MAIEVGDVLRWGCEWLLQGSDTMVNVHTMQVTDVGTTTGDLDFMTAAAVVLETELYDLITDRCVDDLVATVIKGINLTKGETLPVVNWNADGSNAGTEILPAQTAGLVYLNGDQPRRQGRTYIPAISEVNTMSGLNWGAPVLSALLAFGLALLDPLTDGDIAFRRVICHPNGTSPFVPTSAGASAAPRTQRRRTPGRGA